MELNNVGATVFLTTHNMEEANKLCGRIAIINHGKIAAIDTPENLRMKSSSLQSIEVSFGSHNLRIITLNTLAPSLEEVFFKLTQTKHEG